MNLRDVELPAAEDGLPDAFMLREVSARERPGDELIGSTLYELEPGKQLWPYHLHIGNEEWVVVVSGTPSLLGAASRRRARSHRFALDAALRAGSGAVLSCSRA
jgi:uncharacterized cupin superfamily protein